MKKSVVLGLAGATLVAVAGGVAVSASSFAATTSQASTSAGTSVNKSASPATGGAVASKGVPLDLASSKLHVTQKGAVVTVLQGKDKVASMTLSDARYTSNSAHALVTITSKRSVKVDTGQFKVFIDDGDLTISNAKVRVLPAGTHSVTVDVEGMGAQPRGFGWDGTADGVSAQWLRS